MTENSYPFGVSAGDPGDLNTEDQWTKMARLFAATGVVGDPGSAAVQVFADSSGRQVFVRVGRAVVRGVYYENNATKTVAIAANSTGSTRLDRIVLKLDPTGNVITAVAKTGSTSEPALTQDDTGVWEMPLAKVTVANGASTIAAGNVTDERVHTNIDALPCRTVADITAPRFGTMAAEFATGLLKWWNGTLWATLATEFVTRTASYVEQAFAFNVGNVFPSIGDFPGLQATVTVPAGQRVRVRVDVQASVAATTGPAFGILYIREGSTILTQRQYQVAAVNMPMAVEVILSPSAGTHTYKASGSLGTAGTFQIVGSSVQPSFIHVETLGA